MLLLQETHAGIPAKDSVVVPGQAEALRLFEKSQRVDNPFVDVLPRALAAALVPRFRSAFPRDSGVVCAVVRRKEGRDRQRVGECLAVFGIWSVNDRIRLISA